MRNAVIPIVLICSFCSSHPAYAVDTGRAGHIARIAELDGLDKAFAAILPFFESLVSQQQLVPPHATGKRRPSSEAPKVIDLDEARRALTDYLESNADDETLETVLAWLESPLGRKISREEIAAATDPDPTAMQRYLTGLASAPLPRERIELMQRFVAERKMAETLARITRHATIAMLAGLSEGGGCATGDPASIDAELPAHDAAELEEMRQESILRAIFAYRNIRDDEMEEYLRFMTTDRYLQYDGIIRDAIDIGTRNLYRAIGKKMAQLNEEIHPGKGCGCTDSARRSDPP